MVKSKDHHSNFYQKPVKLKNIIGTRFRTTEACIGCRKRKKKCDGGFPCQACTKRNQKCTRDDDGDAISSKPEPNVSYIEPTVDKVTKANNLVKYQGSSFVNLPLQSDNTTVGKIEELQEEDTSKDVSLTTEYFDFEDFINEGLIDFQKTFVPTFAPSPSVSKVHVILNAQDAKFFKYFEEKVANSLSLAPIESNHFVQTFVKLSINEIGPTNAIAAWGSLFYRYDDDDNSNHEKFNKLMNKAIDSISKKFSERKTLTKSDYIYLLNFSLILVGIYICSGDCMKWKIMFDNTYQLLEDYGGIQRFYRDNANNPNIKFLLSNFQYHDIMCSSACANGTLYPIEVYYDIFNDYENEYIDTLQSNIQPLILLLGEILNAKVKINQHKREVSFNYLSNDLEDVRNAFQIELDMCDSIIPLIHQLEEKIYNCKPTKKIKLNNFIEDKLNDKLFPLYQNVCMIHFLLYVKNLSPSSVEIQKAFLESYKLIEELMQSRMVVVMCLPLISISIICVNNISRNAVRKLFNHVLKQCPVNNIKKALLIVEEIWKRQLEGKSTVDWSEIVKSFGWELCVC